MNDLRFDERGWCLDPVLPWAASGAWTLFAAEGNARFDAFALDVKAGDLAQSTLRVRPDKRYGPHGSPNADEAWLELGAREGRGAPPLAPSVVRVRAFPIERGPALRDAGLRAAHAIGGAGMDALVKRARRVVQVSAEGEGDARAPLVAAAVLSATFLAAIVPPSGDAIFGIKGARERLAHAGLGPGVPSR